jgi:hypothetical protein
MKHKHYDVIVAWAEGKKIQIKANEKWFDLNNYASASFCNYAEYRIKPEINPDVVKYLAYSYPKDGIWFESEKPFCHDCIKIVFDGETGILKSAEVINGN